MQIRTRRNYLLGALIAVAALISLGLASDVAAQSASGPSELCHVTDGLFTECPDSNIEWSDVNPAAFPATGGVVYADQADLVTNDLIDEFEGGEVDPPDFFIPDGELDHLMLMYESGRTSPLGPDEYMLVHFMTVDSHDAKLQHYVVRIYTDATVQVFVDGVDQGPGRKIEIDTMRGAVGFSATPSDPTPHVIAEFQIGLEEAGFTVCCYSPDPAWWGSTVPNRPPVAGDDEAEIDDQDSITVPVLSNDSDVDGSLDPTTVAVVSAPERGSAVVNADGTVTYTRGPAFQYGDRFRYTVLDDEGAASNEARVDVVAACSDEIGESLDGGSSPWAAGAPTKKDTDVDQDNLKHQDEIDLGTDPCHHDTDGDGLLDSWEAPPEVPGSGFDLNADGIPEVSRDEVFGPYTPEPEVDEKRRVTRGFLGGRPDPLHKDTYVQIDWQDCRLGNCFEVAGIRVDDMHHAPDLQALQDLRAMFAGLPAANPDGAAGINLHTLVDEPLIHQPNCDQAPSALRDSNFGTPDQRRDAQVVQAKTLAFRYVWSGHSTFRDHDGPCPTPPALDVIRIGFGLIPLPDYDTTPFGQALVQGRDVLLTLGPLWICPSAPLLDGDARCDRGFLRPGIYPATALLDGEEVDVEKPYARLLGRPDPDNPEVGEERGITQLWGRALAHLLGHAHGLSDHAVVGNHPAKSDPLPDGQNYWGPDPYGDTSGLVLARSLYSVTSDGEHLVFEARDDQSGLERITEDTVFDNPLDELLLTDRDGDGVIERDDNCSGFSNPGQEDLDGDGQGDPCDFDQDADGVTDQIDPLPRDTDNDGLDNPTDEDDDADGVIDSADNCPLADNPSQADLDGDGLGDVCDLDADDDQVPGGLEGFAEADPLDPASTPEFVGTVGACSDGLDNDLDGLVDSDDPGCIDADADSLPDHLDPCPQVFDFGWVDMDADGLGNACDEDDDGDGSSDEEERQLGSDPFDPDSTPEHAALPETCADGLDNDGDSRLDTEDPDCRGAASVAMAVDRGNQQVIVFDPASDTILGSLPLGLSDTVGDCSITADGRLGFVTDFANQLWVIDLTASPPRLAPGTNPIIMSNRGEDTSITPDQKFVVVADGSNDEPLSIVDIASRLEVSTFSVGNDHNSVEVLDDGSVLVTSNQTGNVHRLLIDSSGNLTDTGEALFSGGTGFDVGPNNVFGAPGGGAGVVIRRGPRQIRSFTIPGLELVDIRDLTGTSSRGISGLVHPSGSLVYARSNGGAVDAFSFDPQTAELGEAPLFSIPISSAPTFFGMDQMAITADGTKLYVSQPGALNVYDALNATLLTTISLPDLSFPTGVCLSQAAVEPPGPEPGPSDVDSDGVPDVQDNCPAVPNPDQTDANFDGLGDACEDSAQFDVTAFLQPDLDGSTLTEATEPAEGEPPLAEQLGRIIRFRVQVLGFGQDEAIDFLTSLVDSQIDLGIVPPEEKDQLIDEALEFINQPPEADPNGPVTGEEGSPVTFDGSASGDPDGDELELSWSFGDGAFGEGTSPQHTYADNGSFEVCLTATDPLGASHTSCTLAEIANVAPSVDVGDDRTVQSGELLVLAVDFSDPGALDSPWHFEIDWGDGEPETGSRDEQAPFEAQRMYLKPGDYPVTACVTDKDGGQSCDELRVVVEPLPVSIDIKPGSDSNPINLGSRGVIPVAILSTAELDAAGLIDRGSLTFGRTGDEASLQLRGKDDTPNCGQEDIDGDDRTDLVCKFLVEESGFVAGDVEGILKGRLTDGRFIQGMDVVRILDG